LAELADATLADLAELEEAAALAELAELAAAEPEGDVEPLTEVGDIAFELLTDAAEDEAGGVPAEATELAELPLVALFVLLRAEEEAGADERPGGVTD